ncbi:hypothetical protein B0T18DRAFT_425990 [Schizothecium vesticola]|uniref:Uncharacterized protein n=1 Tax=Schizothecium vesticola TaxID=314040 RepID=A0AA40F509_9PEZI|nr:hypothetical protein B0T18DRAFT_425990 [Schizothecium vesticola]
MYSPIKLATALALATFFTSSLTLANPAGTTSLAAAQLDADVGAFIQDTEPNRCCTPGCEYCSTILCEVEGCRDPMYTSCCNYALRSPVPPKTIS